MVNGSVGKTALYAGSFDPFTLGHYDIVQRALGLFEKVIILVAVSPSKKSLLTFNQRVQMINSLYKEFGDRVKVDSFDGLLVNYAKTNKIDVIVRGLRATGDFEIEFQMAAMNRKLYPVIEMVFLMTSEKFYYLSSSLVREVFLHGGDIKNFVPKAIFEQLKKISLSSS